MKNIMKEAHNLTKKIIRKGDSYKATFRICLSYVHSQVKKGVNKMVELKGSEKQVKWALEIREGILVMKDMIDAYISKNKEVDLSCKTLQNQTLRCAIESKAKIEEILNCDNAGKIINELKRVNKEKAEKLRDLKENKSIEIINAELYFVQI